MNKLLNETILAIYFSTLMVISWFIPHKIISFLFLASILGLLCIYFTKPEKLIFLQILFVLQYQHYVSLKLLPAKVSYLTDIILLLIVIHFFKKILWDKGKPSIHPLIYQILILFSVFALIGVITNFFYQFNPILIIWSIRNVGRLIMFIIASLLFISKDNINNYKQTGIIFVWTCGILAILQFISGLKSDFIGGIFGTQQGIANVYLHAFLIVFTVYTLTRYIYHKTNSFILLVSLVYIIGLTVIAELKFLFFEIFYILIILLITLILTRKNFEYYKRFLIVALSSALILVLFIPIFTYIFPQFSDFFDLNSIVERSKSADGLGKRSLTIGRSNFFSHITNKIFKNDITKVLFGIGIGNAEYSSSFDILTSPFYHKLKHTLYFWYSSAWMYIEHGIVGMTLYASIFAVIIKNLYALIKHHFISVFSFTLIACIPLLYLYNSTLRIEAVYIIAVPLIAGCLYHSPDNKTSE